MTNEELTSLTAMAKQCEMNKENKDLQKTFRDSLAKLPKKDQDYFITKFRDESIAVWGQAPQNHTGYGVARDVYSSILTDRLVDAFMVKISLIQNGQGSSDQAISIDKAVLDKMTGLPEDIFKSVSSSISQYTVPTTNQGEPLTTSAQNKISTGLKYLNDALVKATSERTKSTDGMENQ